MPRPTFRKHEHLCSRTRLQEVATTGRSVYDAPFKLVGKRMQLPTNAPAQVAFAIPKRYLRLAVQRNRMRRLMREAYRLNKERYYAALQASGAQCAWLFIYQGKGTITLAETELKITRALDRWLKEHG
ncbi:MAG: ribonuclease P protein component [Flavobacteriales bacterium]